MRRAKWTMGSPHVTVQHDGECHVPIAELDLPKRKESGSRGKVVGAVWTMFLLLLMLVWST